MDGPGGLLFLLVPLFIGGVFAFIIGSLIVTTVRNLSQSPVERTARLVTKRMQVGRHAHAGQHHGASFTRYFATFEFEDGSREEFGVAGSEYGLLVEGDEGVLRSRGSWYQGFRRELSKQREAFLP